jgi:hypothetical protein
MESASPAGLTRGAHLFCKKFYEDDGLHRNSGLSELRIFGLSAASRVNPTCGVKPGNDPYGIGNSGFCPGWSCMSTAMSSAAVLA